MKGEMAAFRQRLQSAIENWGGSKTEFAEFMEARGVRGGSYSSLLSYISGESTPSLEWVMQAAGIMGIRGVWLAFGDGPAYNVVAAPPAITKEKAMKRETMTRRMYVRDLHQSAASVALLVTKGWRVDATFDGGGLDLIVLLSRRITIAERVRRLFRKAVPESFALKTG